MSRGRGGIVGRSLRRIALVAMFAAAAVAAPVALPIRMLIARRQRPIQTTEQVVRLDRAVPLTR
ncbi:MAG TPA: hypothetical protein VFT80_08405 [Actinomycetota bacterium]|nr:hypothetical protein [Actinomycetota bacterium]